VNLNQFSKKLEASLDWSLYRNKLMYKKLSFREIRKYIIVCEHIIRLKYLKVKTGKGGTLLIHTELQFNLILKITKFPIKLHELNYLV